MKIQHLSLLFIGIVVLSACKKDNKEELDIYPARDMATINSAFEDAFSMVDRVGKSEPGLRNNYGLPECATVSVDTLALPFTITIDFGEENCTGNNGINRRGKIHVTVTGPYQDEGTTITTTLEDYFVMDHLLTGARVVSNLGENAQGNLHYSVVESDVTLTEPGGEWTATWQSNRMREWIAGHNTLWNPFDDEYAITGTGSGVSRIGTPYTVTITQPLIAKIICPWVVQGTIDLHPEGGLVLKLDYGAGTCDQQATVTVNDNTYNILLN
jgi:hypothetical protein